MNEIDEIYEMGIRRCVYSEYPKERLIGSEAWSEDGGSSKKQ